MKDEEMELPVLHRGIDSRQFAVAGQPFAGKCEKCLYSGHCLHPENTWL